MHNRLTDKKGNKLTYTYDAMNRITKEACGSEVKGEYTYNDYNYLATAKNGTVSLRYGYYVDGKVLSIYQLIDGKDCGISLTAITRAVDGQVFPVCRPLFVYDRHANAL